jgi:hypothetical protein
MNLRPVLKTFFIKFIPTIFWKGWLKSYYVRKLRLYAGSDKIVESENDLEVVKHVVKPERCIALNPFR